MATAVMTVVGRKKLCKAHAGDITLPKISRMAWGDGGVNEAGTPKIPTGEEADLVNNLLEKAVEAHIYPVETETTCRYTATLEKSELTGKSISEMGLIDEEGDLVAYKTFLPKGKDEDVPMEFNMDEIF